MGTEHQNYNHYDFQTSRRWLNRPNMVITYCTDIHGRYTGLAVIRHLIKQNHNNVVKVSIANGQGNLRYTVKTFYLIQSYAVPESTLV